MTKYSPLAKYLSEIPSSMNEILLHFSKIEEIIGDKLPPSARKHTAWWSNEVNGVHVAGKAWQSVGWNAHRPNFKNETVIFVRKGSTFEKLPYPAPQQRVQKSEDVIVLESIPPKTHSHRSTASFGKRQEYIIVGELLRRGFDVYMTLVDDQQIDCIIRLERGGQPEYFDIQIKARSADCLPQNAGFFPLLGIPNPRDNYFYIFFSEQADMTWVIPSLDLVRLARQNKTGQNVGKYSINLCNHYTSGVKPRPKFKEYEKAFGLIK